MSNLFRIVIMSDLHCKYGGGKSVSEINTYLATDMFPYPVNRNPIESLKDVLSKRGIKSDLLLCPGDITDKCDTQGLITGWGHLLNVSSFLGSRKLVATVGNHDVDSHRIINPDKHPFESIQRLTNYPTPDSFANRKFWSDHYCIIEDFDFALLILNSAFNHLDKDSSKRSQIEETTIENIRKDLEAIELKGKVKVALVHHHPMIHSNMNYKDSDFIDKSDDLLNMLDQYDFDICIHGHKHDPRLEYKNSIPVFACGSFSSTMNLLDTGAQNTFHLISIESGSKLGMVESWVYSPKEGWVQRKDTYFPCHTGFGYRTNIDNLADNIAAWFGLEKKESILYSTLLNEYPDLKYLIPNDQRKLNEKLSEIHKIGFLPELPNIPTNVLKLYS